MKLPFLLVVVALAGCGSAETSSIPGQTLAFDAQAASDATEPDASGAEDAPAGDVASDESPAEADAPGDSSGDIALQEAAPSCANGVQDGDETDRDCGGSCAPCDLGAGCSTGADCLSSSCVAGICSPAECADGFRDGDETDVDCGGSCAGCPDGMRCAASDDCEGLHCRFGYCVAPECADGELDGDETATDCGGSCAPCPAGMPCTADGDCGSGHCDGGACAWPACDDGIPNGTETAVDCGGSCPPCVDGAECLTPSDCLSGRCEGGYCAASACDDGVKNGGETDVDCGGPCPARCGAGKGCHASADCTLGVCLGSAVCALATCFDGQLNGSETDVDCGGGCGPCAVGSPCSSAADCASARCVGQVCVAASCHDGVKNGGESAVDCGGPCAAACALGATCAWNGDCETRHCFHGRCALDYELYAARAYETDAIGHVATTDVDLDGHPDLVAGARGVAVLRNLGGGTFGAASTYSLDSGVDVVVADVNRDGAPDLVAATNTAVTVYGNDLAGGFAVKASIPLSGIKDLEAADIDGDGFVDIVAVHAAGFDTFLNDGTWALAPPVRTPGGAGTAIRALDVYGDGHPELLVSQVTALRVFRHIGAGAFLAGTHIDALAGDNVLAVADFTHDGWSDLLQVDTRCVWANDRQGSFAAGTYGYTMGTPLGSVSDINGDSYPDFLMKSDWAGIDYWLNDHGVLDSAGSYELAWNITDILAADLNGDCRDDTIAVTSGETFHGGAAVALARKDGSFTRILPTHRGGTNAAVGDVTGDGWPDIVTAFESTLDDDDIMLATSQAGHDFMFSVVEPYMGTISSVALFDLNGDQRLDIVTTYQYAQQVGIKLQKADGTFADEVRHGTLWGPVDAAMGDFDADGKMDLAVGCRGDGLVTGGITVLRGIGNGVLQLAADLDDLPHVEAVELGDVDGDGRLDIVATDNGIGGMAYHLGLGNCSFQKAKAAATGVVVQDLAVGDFDGDGTLDGAMTGPMGTQMAVVSHIGAAAPKLDVYVVQRGPWGLAKADVNRDGRDDLLVASSETRSVGVLLNKGDGFAAPVFYAVPAMETTKLEVADLDRDGWLDVVTGDTVTVLYGVGHEDPAPCPVCGDGIRDAREPCDDGNTLAGDGCSPSCQIEPGHVCNGSPSACHDVCGDALIVGAKEECDDGNIVQDDGCSAQCKVEPGWSCSGVVSSCAPVCGDGLVRGDEWCDDGNANQDDGCPSSCQRVIWTRTVGEGVKDQNCLARVNAADEVVIACGFEGTILLGGQVFSSTGGSDVLVATLDRDNNVLSARQVASSGAQSLAWFELDPAGALILGGPFTGTIEFDGSPLAAPTAYSYYIAKLTPTGTHVWSRAFSGASTWWPRDMAVDAAGNTLLAGSYKGAMDLGTGPLPVVAYEEAFLVKVSPAGEVLWANSIAGSDIQRYYEVDTDAAGNIVTLGYNNAYNVPIGGGLTLGAGYNLIKRAPDGTPVWRTYPAVSSSGSTVRAMRVSPSGRTTLFGNLAAPADFGGGTLPVVGDCSPFLVIYEANGAHAASHSFDGASPLECIMNTSTAIGGDAAGNTYVAAGAYTVSGTSELALFAFDVTAQLTWSSWYPAQSTSIEVGSVALAPGRLVAGGALKGSVDYYTQEMTSAGAKDGFVAVFAR